MRLEYQVVSLELAKRMKELGFGQESLWWWASRDGRDTPQKVIYNKIVSDIEAGNNNDPICSAFTVAELGEMLPAYLPKAGWTWTPHTAKYEDEWELWFQRYGERIPQSEIMNQYGATEADCRAKMLIHLKEKGLI